MTGKDPPKKAASFKFSPASIGDAYGIEKGEESIQTKRDPNNRVPNVLVPKIFGTRTLTI